jgi:hypothetical protein
MHFLNIPFAEPSIFAVCSTFEHSETSHDPQAGR